MDNRIDLKFAQLRSRGEKAFISYITAGDPSLAATHDLTLGLEKAGVDILELGIPFSDPLADGVVNQLAAQRGLDAGTTPAGVLECVRQIRKSSQIPIVLYTYMNPIFVFGFDEFHRQAEAAGVDGILILDLPPDETGVELGFSSSIRRIRLIAPTTPPARIKEIAQRAEGFIYYVSREGVTGEQSSVSTSIEEHISEIRAVTDLPIAIGFGVSNPEQAREIAGFGDAVVVGSAIVRRIAEHGGSPELVAKVTEFVTPLVRAIKG